jgi:hypothetical protein
MRVALKDVNRVFVAMLFLRAPPEKKGSGMSEFLHHLSELFK